MLRTCSHLHLILKLMGSSGLSRKPRLCRNVSREATGSKFQGSKITMAVMQKWIEVGRAGQTWKTQREGCCQDPREGGRWLELRQRRAMWRDWVDQGGRTGRTGRLGGGKGGPWMPGEVLSESRAQGTGPGRRHGFTWKPSEWRW